MKKFICLMLTVIMLTAGLLPVCMADGAAVISDIWHKMAALGNFDIAAGESWLSAGRGIYAFGETTGAGYITMSLDDQDRIKESVSFRMYPESDADVELYFAMLECLLEQLGQPKGVYEFDTCVQAVSTARALGIPYPETTKTINTMSWTLIYSAEYNELYSLINGPFLISY